MMAIMDMIMDIQDMLHTQPHIHTTLIEKEVSG